MLEDLTVISDNAVLQKRYESELKETPLRKGEAFTKVTVTVKVNDGVNYGSATFSMNEEAKKDSSKNESVHIEEVVLENENIYIFYSYLFRGVLCI